MASLFDSGTVVVGGAAAAAFGPGLTRPASNDVARRDTQPRYQTAFADPSKVATVYKCGVWVETVICGILARSHCRGAADPPRHRCSIFGVFDSLKSSQAKSLLLRKIVQPNRSNSRPAAADNSIPKPAV